MLRCLMLHFEVERMGRDVRHFPTPEAFHTFKRERFKTEDIIGACEVLR